MKYKLPIILLVVTLSLSSCFKKSEKQMLAEIGEKAGDSTAVKKEASVYQLNGKTFNNYVAFKNDNLKKPIIYVFPEWWGLNDYAKSRADQLAELGYFVVAVDFYGEGKTVENPEDAGKLAEPFYKNAALGKSIFDASKTNAAKYEQANQSETAVIGYCFGGAQALNMARQEADIKGVVSFHGNLMTGVKPNNNAVPYLILNGEDDTFVPQKERDDFKKEMDSAKINYTFINYPGAVHSFTNPNSTEIGKKYKMNVGYNKVADEKSWQEMKTFFSKIFK